MCKLCLVSGAPSMWCSSRERTLLLCEVATDMNRSATGSWGRTRHSPDFSLHKCFSANNDLGTQVEYHVMPPDAMDEGIDPVTPRQMLDIMRALQSRGLRVFHSEPNYWCARGRISSPCYCTNSHQ